MNPSGTVTGTPSMSLTVGLDTNNVPTNRVAGMSDHNGNQSGGFAGTNLIYDVANRVAEAQTGGQSAYYAYDSDNRRIYYRNGSNETIYFYGADGKKLATYTYAIVTNQMTGGNPEIQLTQQSQNVYFAGRLLTAEGSSVTSPSRADTGRSASTGWASV